MLLHRAILYVVVDVITSIICTTYTYKVLHKVFLFLSFRSLVWFRAFWSFSSSRQSLSHLHLSQFHFPLSTSWALTFPQLLWKQRPHLSHCVPDFRILLHALQLTCIKFSPSTPGPGFCSTLPMNNSIAKTAAHRHVFAKSLLTCPLMFLPCAHHTVFAAQVRTRAR
jgi:hypothetical protein